jgi:prepilin-type N-terminal cleavage/methylation domain-containing protein
MNTEAKGFTLIEVLIAGALMAVAMLAMAGMFVAGYSNVVAAGNSTVGVAAARQILEDVRALPFDSIESLDGFDTDDAQSLPDDEAARDFALRWRQHLSGDDGVGWGQDGGDNHGTAAATGATGRLAVELETANLARVTVAIRVPGSFRDLEMFTLVARN